MRRRPIPHRAWRLGALLVFVALCIVGCAPVSGDGGLEVYLRSDLSDSEREQVRFTVHLWARGGVDEAAPLALDARTLDMDALTRASGALLGRFPALAAGRYEVALDLQRPSVALVRADVAAVDFRGAGAQQVVFLVLRGGVVSCDATSPCADEPCATAECRDGSCFVLRAADWTASCECDVDEECPRATGCGASRCMEHSCRVVPDDTRCARNETCRDSLVCDSVTCRGHAAGDACREISSACDREEVCDGVGVDCPPQRGLDVGAPCFDDDTALPGFCTVRAGASELLCDTRCESGRPCQVGCLAGVQVCSPSIRCDTSAGGSVADGTSCGVAELCRAAPTCVRGACTLGAAAAGTICGPDPAPDCVAAPRCDATGTCAPSPAPEGTPCDGGTRPTRCYAFTCSAAGACRETPIPSDPRCLPDPRAPYDECGVASCSPERSSLRWGCNLQPNDDACASELCGVAQCAFTNTMDRGPFYQCQTTGSANRCERLDGTFVSCDPAFDPGPCDLGAQCSDGVRNGVETDVDCGGNRCTRRCDPGSSCLESNDCDVAFLHPCVGGICM